MQTYKVEERTVGTPCMSQRILYRYNYETIILYFRSMISTVCEGSQMLQESESIILATSQIMYP